MYWKMFKKKTENLKLQNQYNLGTTIKLKVQALKLNVMNC